jgi:hypothetical protein
VTATAADLMAACQDEATSIFVLGAVENDLRELNADEWNLTDAAMHAGIAGTLLALERAGIEADARHNRTRVTSLASTQGAER